MGDIIPFKRRERQWTRPEDYGFPGGKPPGKPPSKRKRWTVAGYRPWALIVVLVSAWVLYDPALYEPPAFLSSDPETISGQFTRCGPGRGTNCVVDGDTIKLGERTIRLIGIDAPEVHPARCPAEAEKGEAATAELQRLLNQGPLSMVARIDDPTDKYGRELRALSRSDANGTQQSIAEQLVAGGFVRRYSSGSRQSWCGPTT